MARIDDWMRSGGAARETFTVAASLMIALLGLGCLPGWGEPGPSDVTESSGSTTELACMPGETRVCACPDGLASMETCNVLGTGFDACQCAGTTDGTTTSTTTPGGTSTTSTGSTTGSVDDTSTTTEGTATTGSTDGSSTDGSSTTGEAPTPYGPCNSDGDCMVAGEICVATGGAMPNTVCMQQGCANAGSCPPAPPGVAATPQCSDLTDRGVNDCFLECVSTVDCPDGMICFTAACFWPPP